ncbi:proteasome alpha 1 subunit [Nannochloropsis oceanica]
MIATAPNYWRHFWPCFVFLQFLFVFQQSFSAASSSSPSTTTSAPGGFTAKGELPQMEFARLGAYRFASPSVCVRTRQACYVLCARPERNPLREVYKEGSSSSSSSSSSSTSTSYSSSSGSSTGSGIHLVSPGIGCLCQGQDGDVLAQLGLMRREAERYLHTFAHPISARSLAQRLGAILGGKGQETWSRPPCCISVIMSSSGGSFSPPPSSAAGATAVAGGAVAATAGVGVVADGVEEDREGGRERGGGGGVAAPFSSFPSSPHKGRRKDGCQEAEMYLVDPTGLVLCVRGQAFGGRLVDDPVAHELQEWLAREETFGRIDDGGEGEGVEDEGGEEEGVVWAKLWEGMQKYFPTLVGHPEEVECAKAAGSSFRRVGTLDQVLRCGGK